jgi:hypothetical protein
MIIYYSFGRGLKLFYFVLIVIKEQMDEEINSFFYDYQSCHDGWKILLVLAQSLQFEPAKFS